MEKQGPESFLTQGFSLGRRIEFFPIRGTAYERAILEEMNLSKLLKDSPISWVLAAVGLQK
jgi:hypothetical protein